MNADKGHAAYMREWRRRNRESLLRGEIEIEHGTRNGYSNYGCRCDLCALAQSEWSSAREREDGVAARHLARTRRQRAAVPETGRARSVWTGAEIAVATDRRPDTGEYVRTAQDVACILGRTVTAVQGVRVRCLHDPRYLMMTEDG